MEDKQNQVTQTQSNGALTKDSILKAEDRIIAKVKTPEWAKDSYVYVRNLSAAERDEWESSLYDMDGEGNVTKGQGNSKALLCILGICDEKGKRLFGKNDLEAVGKKNSIVIGRIAEKVSDISGISKKEREKLEKNFENPTD